MVINNSSIVLGSIKQTMSTDLVDYPGRTTGDFKYFIYRAVRENLNGDGDWLNLFFHVEYTCHVSRNTFVKVYKEPAGE